MFSPLETEITKTRLTHFKQKRSKHLWKKDNKDFFFCYNSVIRVKWWFQLVQNVQAHSFNLNKRIWAQKFSPFVHDSLGIETDDTMIQLIKMSSESLNLSTSTIYEFLYVKKNQLISL